MSGDWRVESVWGGEWVLGVWVECVWSEEWGMGSGCWVCWWRLEIQFKITSNYCVVRCIDFFAQK